MPLARRVAGDRGRTLFSPACAAVGELGSAAPRGPQCLYLSLLTIRTDERHYLELQRHQARARALRALPHRQAPRGRRAHRDLQLGVRPRKRRHLHPQDRRHRPHALHRGEHAGHPARHALARPRLGRGPRGRRRLRPLLADRAPRHLPRGRPAPRRRGQGLLLLLHARRARGLPQGGGRARRLLPGLPAHLPLHRPRRGPATRRRRRALHDPHQGPRGPRRRHRPRRRPRRRDLQRARARRLHHLPLRAATTTSPTPRARSWSTRPSARPRRCSPTSP